MRRRNFSDSQTQDPPAKIPTDYCACVCDLPTVEFLTRTRHAYKGQGYEVSPPAIAANVYSRAVTALASAPYSAYAPCYVDSLAPLAAAQTRYDRPDSGNRVFGFNSSTSDESVSGGEPRLITLLSESQYQLRITFPAPWKGSETFRVHWREMKVKSTGTITIFNVSDPFDATPPAYEEAAKISFVDKSALISPGDGGTEFFTAEYSLDLPGLGESLYLVGPSAVGKWCSGTNLGSLPRRGLLVLTQRVEKVRNGFMPYTRTAASPAAGAALGEVTVYSTETASKASDAAAAFSGNQTLADNKKIAPPYLTDPRPAAAFSADVPAGYYSTVNGARVSGTYPKDRNFGDVEEISETIVVYKNGLRMELSGEVKSSHLVSNVEAELAALDSSNEDHTEGYGVSLAGPGAGEFCRRRLAGGGTAFTLSKSWRLPFFDFQVISGVMGVTRFVPGDGSNVRQNLLASAGDAVAISVQTLDVNLDTNAASPTGELSYSAPFDYSGLHYDKAYSSEYTSLGVGGPRAASVSLGDIGEDVAAPTAGNVSSQYKNWKVTTETLERLLIGPQVEAVEP